MNQTPRKAPPAHFVIVQRQPDRRRLVMGLLVLAWAASLSGAWVVSGRLAAMRLPGVSQALEQTRQQMHHYRSRYEMLKQREATLARSDQISRVANVEIQNALAERDDAIAELRSDLAFYERLVGATAQKKGLNVHSTEFERESGGTWRYLVVLTQTLNRSAVSLGELRFSVEGVYDGKLTTLDWDELHQQQAAPAQAFSFRYFQQLQGSVMLPPGFTPQRVRVSLRGEKASIEQTLAWNGNTAQQDT